MKVLIIDQISSVNWKYTYSLANALIDAGNDVTVVTDLMTEKYTLKGEQILLFNTSSKELAKTKKLFNYYTSYKKIISIVKTKEIDVVHFQWHAFTPLDYYFIKKIQKRAKVVFTIHDVIDFDNHFYDKHYLRKIFNTVDSIIIQTEANVELFKEYFPSVDSQKISLAYHGHFLEFAHLLPQKFAREKLGIPNNQFVYLFFGQLKKIKGVDLLIKAFSKVVEQKENVFLVIAGNVWKNDFGIYQKIIDDLHLNNNIKADIFFIPDDQVDIYFSAADIICLPYIELFQSGVVQLSYAYKKPAIASDLPGFLTVIQDKKTGYVFQTGSIDMLAEKMMNAYDEKENLIHMGEEGYRYIHEKFSWKKIADTVNQVYKRRRK